MRYHKYLRNFIDQHPKRSIPSSILFYSKKTGGILNEDALCQIYTKKLKPYFVKLLDTAYEVEEGKRSKYEIVDMIEAQRQLLLKEFSRMEDVGDG
jgi:hypothetical protein